MPALLVTVGSILTMTSLWQWFDKDLVGKDAVASLLYVFNWWQLSPSHPSGVGRQPFDHFWSLAIEEQFYLFVALALLLVKKPVEITIAMLICGLGGIMVWWGDFSWTYQATPVRGMEIALGGCLALGATRYERIAKLGQPSEQWFGAKEMTIIAAGVGIASTMSLHQTDWWAATGFVQLLGVCWVVLLASSLNGGVTSSILCHPILRWVGTRSYALYLFHYPVALLTDSNPLLVVPISFAAAEVSYRWVEMPVLGDRNRGTLFALAAAAILSVGWSVGLVL